ncbi:hypothetical protein BO83DRAFT_436284 [Aspergillus eucalypticola CBS 122712]|uniref:Uncharacterized protein n=1 Tax=Aspergillus eucalypticola (strain CBS 122712 / IBT 29274) TaxID=1448314 RepID=A0A317VY43_ASPEC|nr:uncharacterized protein BO83DRAFT_436284 [Aspergillus eucalypticola CBS 122712]PWY76800.1 hypothetical protein BO83DRAFT_436284 [Aspergillus eucalypticola CBS 122712]
METQSRQDVQERLKSIQRLMEETCAQFEKITKRRLESRRFEDVKSFEDLMKKISSGEKGDDDESRETRQKFLAIVSALQTLTGPVKCATDIAFSPASACASALSFILEIPSKVHGIHESIRAVIDEVEPRFTEIRVYYGMGTVIDPVLIISVCNVMMAFIILCAQCVKLLEKGKAYRYFKEGKWIMSNQNPIRDSLDKLKALAEQKEQVQSMIILKEILNSSDKIDIVDGKIDGISEYVSKRSDEVTRQDDLSRIKKDLRVTSKDGVLMGHRVYTETLRMAKDKTCQFLESKSYMNWALNKDEGVPPLLLITGEVGTGKSVCAASMFLDIKKKETFAAYYSFSPMPKSPKDHQQPLEDCVRATGLQLAEQNLDYRRRLLHLLKMGEGRAQGTDYKGLLDTLNVWQAPDKMVCYLVLDGLDNLAEQECKDFMNHLITNQIPSKRNSLRVCVTGSRKLLRAYSKRKDCLQFEEIECYTERVIADYTGKFLEKKDLLQEDFLDFADLRESICEAVTSNACGSFHKVQKWLDRIESVVQSDNRDELTRFLSALSRGGSDLARSELQDLERTLDWKEIAELNELIIWSEFNMSKDVILDIDQLEAFLWEQKFICSNSPPLSSLRKKIRGRFSSILEERDDGVRLRKEMKHLVILDQNKDQHPAISATISVQNTSIEVAQRFFWDLANHSVMNRFNFDANQMDMAKPSTHRIRVTKLNAHLVIVKRTFEFLRKAPDPLSRPVGGILLEELPAHLAVLQEPSQLEQLKDTDRRTIGENVQEIFLSPMSLERHWDVLQQTRWHTSPDAIDAFWKWLSDDAAIKHPIIRDKIREVWNDPKRNQKLFEPLARLAGQKWLQDRSPSSTTASFEWLRAFLNMDAELDYASQNSDFGSEEDDHSFESNDSIKDDDVTKAEKWCERVLGPSRMREQDVWVQRLAETYEYADSHKKAFKKYRETSKLLERMGDIDQERQGKVLVRLASLTGDEDQALQYLKQALSLSASNINARYALIKSLWSRNCREELSDLVLDTLKPRTASGPMGHLGLVIQMAIEDSDYDDTQMMNLPYIISSICSSSADNFASLLENMQTATENAKAQNRVKTWTTLLLHKGMALACYSDDPYHADQAVKSWTECADTIMEELKYQSAGAILLDRVGRQLGCHYFTQTLKDPDNAETYSRKLEEVYQNQRGIVHGMSAAKTYLAADLIRRGKQPDAEALFQANIREAFGLLSDDTTGNDMDGFCLLFLIFLHTGDRVNALNAYSLLARRVLDAEILKEWLQSDEKTTTLEAAELREYFQEVCNEPTSAWYKVIELVEFLRLSQRKLMNETLWSDDDAAKMKSYEALLESMNQYAKSLKDAHQYYLCDACDCYLDTSRSMYACKFCHDFALCESCFHRFQHGVLKMSLCHIEHDYVRIPPWDAKAHVRAFRRRVLMDATVADDGYLVGGREVPVVEWLNCMKEKWDPQGDWDFR